MPIVTLTSDFGLTDYYLATIKGTLLSQLPDISLVDISHNVKNYDIVQGAFILKNAYPNFPPGTIHLVSINSSYSATRCFIAIRYQDHYFIGPDNGIFSLLFSEKPQSIYELGHEEQDSFPEKDVFAKAVKHLGSGLPLNELGIPLDDMEQRISFQPVIGPSQIKGTVIYIDNYENVMVNISQELFEQLRKKRPFEVHFKRFGSIRKISHDYSNVAVGETLCRFNSAGLLEIAVHTGKASTLLGLQIDDVVQIEFE